MVYNSPDLHLPQSSLLLLIKIHIDREMSIDISHLVLEPLGHTDDKVVDEGADGAESGHALAAAVVHFDVDDILRRVREADGEMAEVLDEFAARAFDGYGAGFDVDFDYINKVY